MYTDKNCEYQAIACIQTLLPRIRPTDKIVYYTIGFNSDYEANNLYKMKIGYKDYPTFHYYKAELSLLTMDLFPHEEHFLFTDTDVLFSKRFNPALVEHTHEYPLASFGPHEYPFIYETINGEQIIYNETKLMDYLGVKQRSLRYVWSCIYSFNRKCRDFMEEYTSFCKNEYLIARRKYYFPFHDETSFNVCLFKRNASQSLGYAFVNTHNPDLVKIVETNDIKDKRVGMNIDALGNDWEYIHDSEKVIMYHGFKNKTQIDLALKNILV